MHKLTRMALIAIIVPLSLTSTAIASAAPPDGARLPVQMPLDATFRTCAGNQLDAHVASNQFGRAMAEVTRPGSNTVAAAVTLATAVPNTHYDVRIIQIPRSTLSCAAGDPGVIAGGFETDATGAGGVTLEGPIQSGATGAWIALDRPAPNSQKPAEFYTSTFAAGI